MSEPQPIEVLATDAAPPANWKDGNLAVVMSACSFAADRRSALIVIQSRNPDFPRAIEELREAPARHLALAYAAAQGLGQCGVAGNVVGPFPINSDGVALENVADSTGRTLPPQHPQMQPASYRVEIPVRARMGA